MQKRYESKTGLFLIELIIVILFFSIASAICIQIFAKSHLMSRKTINSNHAMFWIQNVTEVFYSENGDLSKVKSYFPVVDTNHFTSIIPEFISSYDNAFAIQFDSNWNTVVSAESHRYTLLALYSGDSDFHTLELCVYENPENIINTSSYETFLEDLNKQDIWNYHIQIVKYKQKGV